MRRHSRHYQATPFAEPIEHHDWTMRAVGQRRTSSIGICGCCASDSLDDARGNPDLRCSSWYFCEDATLALRLRPWCNNDYEETRPDGSAKEGDQNWKVAHQAKEGIKRQATGKGEGQVP